jgi:hypothetical protein
MGMKVGKLASRPFMQAFEKLMKLDDVPPSTCFKLRGHSKLIQEELVKYEETRKSLVEKASDKDKKGNPIIETKDGFELVSISPEKRKLLDKKIMELALVEVAIPPIKLGELTSTPGAKLGLTPDDFFQLEFIEE